MKFKTALTTAAIALASVLPKPLAAQPLQPRNLPVQSFPSKSPLFESGPKPSAPLSDIPPSPFDFPLFRGQPGERLDTAISFKYWVPYRYRRNGLPDTVISAVQKGDVHVSGRYDSSYSFHPDSIRIGQDFGVNRNLQDTFNIFTSWPDPRTLEFHPVEVKPFATPVSATFQSNDSNSVLRTLPLVDGQPLVFITNQCQTDSSFADWRVSLRYTGGLYGFRLDFSRAFDSSFVLAAGDSLLLPPNGQIKLKIGKKNVEGYVEMSTVPSFRMMARRFDERLNKNVDVDTTIGPALVVKATVNAVDPTYLNNFFEGDDRYYPFSSSNRLTVVVISQRPTEERNTNPPYNILYRFKAWGMYPNYDSAHYNGANQQFHVLAPGVRGPPWETSGFFISNSIIDPTNSHHVQYGFYAGFFPAVKLGFSYDEYSSGKYLLDGGKFGLWSGDYHMGDTTDFLYPNNIRLTVIRPDSLLITAMQYGASALWSFSPYPKHSEQPLLPPTGLYPSNDTAIAPGLVHFSARPVSGATYYRFSISSGASAAHLQADTTMAQPDLSYSIPSAGDYVWSMAAGNNCGLGPQGESRTLHSSISAVGEGSPMPGFMQIFPNPSHDGEVSIRINRPTPGKVHLDIYNSLGQKLETIDQRHLGGDMEYHLHLNARGLLWLREEGGKAIPLFVE